MNSLGGGTDKNQAKNRSMGNLSYETCVEIGQIKLKRRTAPKVWKLGILETIFKMFDP